MNARTTRWHRQPLGEYDGGVSASRVPLTVKVPALAAGGAASLAAEAAGAETALDRIYQDHNLQTTLPIVDVATLTSPGVTGAPWLLWLLLAGVVAVLLSTWLGTVDWTRLRERRRPRTDTVAAAAGGNRDQSGLDTADAYAREGRYGAAIHALLLDVLRTLADAKRWPAAATAREIAAKHLPMEDLRLLVSAAELAHFGGRPASEAEYLDCRGRALRLRESASPTNA